MSHIPFQLAPGLGELLPGNFVLPQNPLHPMAGVRVPHVGELLPAKFSQPENPLLRAVREVKPGCGCRHGLGCPCALTGLGDLGFLGIDMSTVIPDWPWTTWAMVGGGLLVLTLLVSRGGKGSQYRTEKRLLEKRLAGQYRSEMSKLRSKYPRVGGRATRALRAGYGAAAEAY